MDWSKEIPFPASTPWLLIATEQDFESLSRDWKTTIDDPEQPGLTLWNKQPEFDHIFKKLPKGVFAQVHWNTRNMPPPQFPIKKQYRVYEVKPDSKLPPKLIYRDDEKQTAEMKEQAKPWYDKEYGHECCVCLKSLNKCGVLASCSFDQTVSICGTCREQRSALATGFPREMFVVDMNDDMWKRLCKYTRLEEEALHKIRFG